ncbi:MAG TPA: VWA domain-containing protein [Bryobacteraceae bacterium]|nr:VWA domain-containing protein [Bryobacteraceae bacterium]
MKHPVIRRKGERGFVMLLYTLMMLFVIVPVVGLAIDAGILYTIKAKLQSAVDGASLGAARSLNRSSDIMSQETDATDAATRYYHANFPTNWMGVSTVNDPTVDWSHSTASTAIIDVTGTVSAPTWFMRIFNINAVNVAATGEATRRNVDIMLVIDRSSSLGSGPGGTNSCPSLISSAQLFVNSFSNNRDKLGLTTFGTYYNNDFALTTDFLDSANSGANSLSSHVLPQLYCAGFTNSAAAFSYAYYMLKGGASGSPDLNALNVILFFTDGQPNTITFGKDYGTGSAGYLPLSASSTCQLNTPLSPTTRTGLSGVIAGDVSVDIWGGIFAATNSTYPVSSSGDFGSGNIIGTAQGRKSGTCNSFKTTPTGTANTAPLGTDIGNLPSTDAWGNSINSTWSGGSSSGTGYTFPETVNLTGSSEWTQTNLQHAGINALDNAAQNARINANSLNMPFVIYTIGLGNASGGVPDELLRRVANDPTAAVYQTAYPAGIYVSSPDTAHLAAAFATIADDIMRISK